MSFRPKGHARTSPVNPQAWAVCDRCGFVYNHIDLFWQFDWQGPRLQNLRILVCRECMDLPFEHGRTIVLPPDPIPIAQPRPEQYSMDDDPDSFPAPNYDPMTVVAYGSTGMTKTGNIGNMNQGGGVDAAFYGTISSGQQLPSSVAIPTLGSVTGPSKNSARSALKMPSVSGLNNYVGQNWAAQPGAPVTLSSAIQQFVNKLTVAKFTLQAPSDQPFLANNSSIAIELDGWDGSSWNSLYSGATVGTKGETLTVTLTSTGMPKAFYGHRVLLNGDGTNAIAVSELRLISAAEFVGSSIAPATQAS